MAPRAVFLDWTSVDRGDLDTAEVKAVADWIFHEHTPPEALPDRLAGAEIAVANKTPLDGEAMDRAPDLRLIVIAATGTDNVDLAAARARGIHVANAVGYATPSVVQHVFALLLGLATHLREYDRAVVEGRWSAAQHFCLLEQPIHELAGRRLGIAGFGELGSNVAQVAEAFGLEVVVAALPGRPPGPDRVPFYELLPKVDVLSLHCPLTPETAGLVDGNTLARMRNDALLLNTARGGLVDEPALAEALCNGRIGGAGLDVLSQEPPPLDHPLLAPDIPNILRTPHTAWASQAARQRLLAEVTADIRAWRAGAERNRVA